MLAGQARHFKQAGSHNIYKFRAEKAQAHGLLLTNAGDVPYLQGLPGP